MAGRPTESEAVLVPAAEPAGASYDRDFCAWSLEQARLVREGRWDAVDRDNVAEEIESLGRAQLNQPPTPPGGLIGPIPNRDPQPAPRAPTSGLSISPPRPE